MLWKFSQSNGLESESLARAVISKYRGTANKNTSGPFFSPARLREKLVSSSLVSSLPLLSEDWDPAFGLYKTNLGEEWRNWNGGKTIFKKIGFFFEIHKEKSYFEITLWCSLHFSKTEPHGSLLYANIFTAVNKKDQFGLTFFIKTPG